MRNTNLSRIENTSAITKQRNNLVTTQSEDLVVREDTELYKQETAGVDMEEIKELYEQCIEYKMKIEVCYASVKKQYLTLRQNILINIQQSSIEIKEELQEIYENMTVDNKITLMIESYKTILIKFITYKKKINLLLKQSRTLLSNEEINIMIKDQNKMMSYITQINEQIPEEQITEIYDYVESKNL